MGEGFCRYCGRASKRLSTRGICPACRLSRMKDTLRQLSDKEGPMYDRWRESTKAAIERLEGEVKKK